MARMRKWKGDDSSMKDLCTRKERKENDNKHKALTRQPASHTMSRLWLLRENS
jgi:hypothetical protein